MQTSHLSHCQRVQAGGGGVVSILHSEARARAPLGIVPHSKHLAAPLRGAGLLLLKQRIAYNV